jgi:hypothetical protein
VFHKVLEPGCILSATAATRCCSMASSLWRDREIQSVVLLVPYLLAARANIDRAARLRTVETGN